MSPRGYGPSFVRLTDDPVAYYVGLAAQDSELEYDRTGVQRHFDFDVHETDSTRDPGPHIDVDEEVRRYLGMCGEKPQIDPRRRDDPAA